MPRLYLLFADLTFVTALLGVATSCSTPSSADACGSGRAAMLAMPLKDFDQGPNGWRSVQESVACPGEAARVIAAYREIHRRTLTPSDVGLLVWHEAQARAFDGETAAAIPLFEQSTWNGEARWMARYRQATIAFLRSDRMALEQARNELASEGLADRSAPNLDVVDGLIQCFGRPYRTAYACRPPHTENGVTFYPLPPED